ncbi:hypothetical protein NDU88_002191 [Pleurodeles waltl]|uniref:Uncharacterized protein n=1 Tax=Pleurodeles waltl TaxID=8319 RepID=A0AAV7M060_PLEWA|nr:hypothetical protein NDU88_002191 [Pleurodeles waltl]
MEGLRIVYQNEGNLSIRVPIFIPPPRFQSQWGPPPGQYLCLWSSQWWITSLRSAVVIQADLHAPALGSGLLAGKGGAGEKTGDRGPSHQVRPSGFRSLSGLPRPRRSRFYFAAGRRPQTSLLQSRPGPLSASPCDSVMGPGIHVGEGGEAGG